LAAAPAAAHACVFTRVTFHSAHTKRLGAKAF
jgi:hypothetical protein